MRSTTHRMIGKVCLRESSSQTSFYAFSTTRERVNLVGIDEFESEATHVAHSSTNRQGPIEVVSPNEYSL